MKITYFLTGMDEDSNIIFEHDMTADEVVPILAAALKNKETLVFPPAAVAEIHIETAKKFSEKQLFPTKKNKGSGCPGCGSVSKHKATCTVAGKPKKEKTVAAGTSFARAPRQACEECGSTGATHFLSCSKHHSKKKPTGNAEWAKLEAAPTPKKPSSRMPVEKFQQVKIADSHNLGHDTIAIEMKLPMDEVIKAVRAKTYEEYLSR